MTCVDASTLWDIGTGVGVMLLAVKNVQLLRRAVKDYEREYEREQDQPH